MISPIPMKHLTTKFLVSAVLSALTVSCGSNAAKTQVNPELIEKQLQEMTLREKVGQLFCVRPEAFDVALEWDTYTKIATYQLQAVNEQMVKVNAEYPAGGIILFLGRRFVNALANILSLRGGTIIRMLWSLAAYIGIFFLAYRCLVFSGMNPTTLMASAGIVSVVIGIGANSLVGDILAGIFLLMEGDIQVGDVVKVGDFRGYVQDMGIRRTRIFDMDTEDVKVFPNKNMQDVINMSENASIVGLKFCISYEEDLERVEKLLTEELKTMYGQVQHLLGEPRYLGLKAMEVSGTILLCTARCHEANRGRVEREINRRVYLMFQKNGIEIPYPQVTVHEAE